MVSIDIHRPWRGELLEREQQCGSFHMRHTHNQLGICPSTKELGRRNEVVLGGVKRLAVRGGREPAAG